MSNRHYQEIKCSFNLPSKTYFSGRCKGDGITLGLTDGEKNGGFFNSEVDYGLSYADTDVYGSSVGSYSSVATSFNSQRSVGITLDASKSGIICEADSNIVLVIKY